MQQPSILGGTIIGKKQKPLWQRMSEMEVGPLKANSFKMQLLERQWREKEEPRAIRGNSEKNKIRRRKKREHAARGTEAREQMRCEP